jgi:hypothetical protein
MHHLTNTREKEAGEKTREREGSMSEVMRRINERGRIIRYITNLFRII